MVVSAAAEIHTEPSTTSHGLDTSFATNHLGLHAMLQQLEPALLHRSQMEGVGRPRVVLIGSRLETKGSTLLSIPTLESTNGKRYDTEKVLSPMDRYATTKFGNMLLAQSLSDRWRERGGPSVYVLTPGMVNTGLWRNFPVWYRALTWPLRTVALRTTEEAALGVVWAVTAVEAEKLQVKGSYVYLSDGTSIEPSTAARDSAMAQKLYGVCEGLIRSAKQEKSVAGTMTEAHI